MLERLPTEVSTDDRFVFDVQAISDESLEFIEVIEARTEVDGESIDPRVLQRWEPSCVLELRPDTESALVLL